MGKQKHPHRAITDQGYKAALKFATDVIFYRATYVCDWTWEELADAAKLQRTTVRRLGSRITEYPRWQTFWKLATAVGLNVDFTDPRTNQPVRTTTRPRKTA